jgi:uncharacterized membrane protein
MSVRGLVISAFAVAAMAALSAWGWVQTAPGAEIPVHWSATGEVNRYGSRLEAFATMPVIAAVISLLLAFAPKIDPRGRNLAKSGALLMTVWMGVLALLFVAHLALVLSATGTLDPEGPLMPRLILLAVCAFMVVLGNLLGKARPNWFVGVRTPWTLSSDRSWDITHRWAGRGFVATGLAGGAAIVVAPVEIGLGLFFGLLAATALGSILLSYLTWRSDPDRETYSETD